MFRRPGAPLHAACSTRSAPEQARALTRCVPDAAPAPGARSSGYRFHVRCSFVVDACKQSYRPASIATTTCACIRAEESAPGTSPRRVRRRPRQGPRDHPLRRGLSVYYSARQDVYDVTSTSPGEGRGPDRRRERQETTVSRSVGDRTRTGPQITFDGDTLAGALRRATRPTARRAPDIFQNPSLSLNPRLTIEQIVNDPIKLFGIAKGKEATDRVVDLLDQVALGPRMLKYQASRLSGGERQRVAIARALAAEPDVLICDEITSALDVSVQGSIVALLEGLRRQRGISMLFVTHNLALVRSIAARVEILQAGRVVEAGSVVTVIETPREEYTRNLLSKSPRIN